MNSKHSCDILLLVMLMIYQDLNFGTNSIQKLHSVNYEEEEQQTIKTKIWTKPNSTSKTNTAISFSITLFSFICYIIWLLNLLYVFTTSVYILLLMACHVIMLGAVDTKWLPCQWESLTLQRTTKAKIQKKAQFQYEILFSYFSSWYFHTNPS